MKNFLVLVILGALAWYGYGKYSSTHALEAGTAASSTADGTARASPYAASTASTAPTVEQFNCDGRTHCSQMRSCVEATYFIQHCPNTEMDGDNDGVPCERQWCN